jgi:Phosphodiester glycosidase
MIRRVAALICLLAAAFPAVALAQPKVTLMPGVTDEKGVQFTPHGAVAFHVITAPKPGGLYAFGPAIAKNLVMGGKERVTEIQRDVSAQATVAGINGDLYNWNDSHPTGVYMEGGVLKHPPVAGRSSIGVDSTGLLHVDRLKFFGTWKGTGQRRPLNGLNQAPANGQVILFTPAWGPATPRVANAAEVVLQPFPPTVPNVDVAGPVTALATGGGTAIPPDGAVLMAVGTMAPKLQAEAPIGTSIASRLILQPSWTGVTDALGGGPVLVRNGKAIFRSLEDFTSDQVSPRNPRAGVGQTADGRILLVAVDGRQPGYSVGMSTFELAQTLVRLGAVTGSAVDSGGSVTVAFDGTLLNRPSDPGGERPVKEALLVKYFGVYAPPPTQGLVTASSAERGEELTYKIVRPSTVTATLTSPNGTPTMLESQAAKEPGVYKFGWSTFDAEGTWRFDVLAVDDLGRQSTIQRTFQYDLTLSSLRVPRTAKQKQGLGVAFTLSRPARVALRIETKLGTTVKALPAVQLGAGESSLRWDGKITARTLAFPGSYVARVLATSEVGKMDLSAPFTLRK